MKRKNNKGFTLIELLAVIVILAIILVIAIPKIMDTIRRSRIGAMESSAKLAASAVEKRYELGLIKSATKISLTGSCLEIAGMDLDEYKECTYTIDPSTKEAVVDTKGDDDGKFSGIICCGATKTEAECSYSEYCPGEEPEEEEEENPSEPEEEEELTETPAECFNTEVVDDGIKITSYNLSNIVSYDIDKELCMEFLESKIDNSEDLEKLCSKGEISYTYKDDVTKTGDLLTLASYYEYGTQSPTLGKLIRYDIIKNLTYENDCTGDIVIPKQINGKSVVEIGMGAFMNREFINEDTSYEDGNMTLLNSTLEDVTPTFMSFVRYEGLPLKSVVLPKTLKRIDDGAFYNHMLTSITIPNSVTTIGADAFDGWYERVFYGLENLTLGNSVQIIGAGAFYGNNLTTLTIPDSVLIIKEQAFANNLLTSVDLGSGVQIIGDEAFENNELTSFVIPDSVTSVGKCVLNCDSYSSSANQITSLTIGKNVTYIGNYAFSGVRSLTQDGITDRHENYLTVGTKAFYDTTITLENSNISGE